MSTQPADPTLSAAPALVQLLQSIHAVRLQLGSLTRDKLNPFTKSNYVTINAIYDQLLPLLAEHDLYLTTRVIQREVVTAVYHTSGAALTSSFPLPQTDDVQKIGGGMTYGTRYNIVAMFALMQEDDDGNTAASRPPKAKSGVDDAPF